MFKTKLVAEAPALYTATQQQAALDLALQIDETVKEKRRDNWRGDQGRENEIKAALFGLLKSVEKVEQIFPIIVQQKEY